MRVKHTHVFGGLQVNDGQFPSLALGEQRQVSAGFDLQGRAECQRQIRSSAETERVHHSKEQLLLNCWNECQHHMYSCWRRNGQTRLGNVLDSVPLHLNKNKWITCLLHIYYMFITYLLHQANISKATTTCGKQVSYYRFLSIAVFPLTLELHKNW